MTTELWRRSATELAALIRDREATSREVVEAHLARIEAVNGHVNAVTVVLAESARAAADEADRRDPVGPLHGVPFTIKENIDCAGSATTNGLPALAEALPPVDAPVVQRMKAAGAIPLARTNLPEMGLRIDTDNPLRGRTHNPWSRTLTCGGSSGGEGAALATGMTPIGLGNDIGGSLRNPAYCCGITSLKPSTGRVPHALSLPPQDGGIAEQLMAVEGPMARSVLDLRLALAILAGRDPRDPVSVDAPLEGPAPASRSVALVTEVPGVTLPPATVAAVRRAGEVLVADGYEVAEAAPPELERVTEIWARVITGDFAYMMGDLGALMSTETLGSLARVIYDYPPAEMNPVQVYAERQRLCRAWSAFFAQHPVIVGPTWTGLPFPHDADLDPDTGAKLIVDRLRFITPGNVLGLPAVALPMGVADGLPTSVQIYADRWREDLCLAAAEVVERSVGTICPIDPV